MTRPGCSDPCWRETAVMVQAGSGPSYILIVFEPYMLCQSFLNKLDEVCVVGNLADTTQETPALG